MSHSSHPKAVRDAMRPLAHRASHARSCALHVANRLDLSRDELIALVASRTGANLHHPDNVQELLLAFKYMESMDGIIGD